MRMKLELVPIPVANVDNAKAFYTEKLGFIEDHDIQRGDMRIVQLTPPGSACSILLGTGVIDTAPGSVQLLHLVVSEIRAVRAKLAERGVDITEVEDLSAPGKPTVSYAYFKDPDGNGWTLQEIGVL
jgi:catechol 2,3-dioxygenase-like lactoylglutathione lyase family enzyme